MPGGGSLVTIIGANFFNPQPPPSPAPPTQLLCRFGAASPTAGLFLTGSSVQCTTAAQLADPPFATVFLSFNALYFHAGLDPAGGWPGAESGVTGGGGGLPQADAQEGADAVSAAQPRVRVAYYMLAALEPSLGPAGSATGTLSARLPH